MDHSATRGVSFRAAFNLAAFAPCVAAIGIPCVNIGKTGVLSVALNVMRSDAVP